MVMMTDRYYVVMYLIAQFTVGQMYVRIYFLLNQLYEISGIKYVLASRHIRISFAGTNAILTTHYQFLNAAHYLDNLKSLTFDASF